MQSAWLAGSMPTPATLRWPTLAAERARWNAFDIVRSTLTEGSADAQASRERKECRAAFKNCAAPMAVIKNFIPMRAARAAV